jgi:hypothetical protein
VGIEGLFAASVGLGMVAGAISELAGMPFAFSVAAVIAVQLGTRLSTEILRKH